MTQQDLVFEPVEIVPNEWNKAFHVVQGNLTFDHENQPNFFNEWQDALAWCREKGIEPEISWETIRRWADPSQCSVCLWHLWGMTSAPIPRFEA